MSISFTWVYLMKDPFTRLHKIGKSDKPDERLKQLCSPSAYGTIPAAPTDYEIVEAWLCPETIERSMHEHYEARRVRGEWFSLNTQHLLEVRQTLSCYRRWTTGTTLDRERYERYFQYSQHYAKTISSLEKEVKVLLRQRTHLVRQRDELTMFSEPQPETLDQVESVEVIQ